MEESNNMRIRPKPKIICTLGTTTDDYEVLEGMVRHGMNCARINTAYATLEEYKDRIDTLKSIADLPVMMDIKGPQVRVKSEYNLRVSKGDEIMLGFNQGAVHFTKDFLEDLEVDDKITFENGTIETLVIAKNKPARKVTLKVINPGNGDFHKDMGANVPGKYLNVERFSKKDLEVVDFTIKNNLDYIALSFTRDKEDVKSLYELINKRRNALEEGSRKTENKHKNKEYNPLSNYNLAQVTSKYQSSNYQNKYRRDNKGVAEENEEKEIGIIAKIEDEQGIDNLEDILSYVKRENIKFGVMIARGDMFVELPYYKMPRYQKDIIRLCKKYDVSVITATGLLGSMTESKKPARAEVSDVANAVLDGSDALMLSAETSNSQNPVLAVKVLSEIMREYMPKYRR